MYGTARLRAYYGAGDPAFTAGRYYAAGGFFKKLFKGVKKGLSFVTKNPIVGTALSFVPGGGAIGKVVGLATSARKLGAKAAQVTGIKALGQGMPEWALNLASKMPGPGGRMAKGLNKKLGGALDRLAGIQPAITGSGVPMLPSHGPALPGFSSKRRRRKASRAPARRGRARAAPRRRRSSRGRGDYGQDWQGNRPSRAKGSGQFLTRRGGRRRRRRGGGGGGRVSFTTKSGKRVSFTARRGATGRW